MDSSRALSWTRQGDLQRVDVGLVLGAPRGLLRRTGGEVGLDVCPCGARQNNRRLQTLTRESNQLRMQQRQSLQGPRLPRWGGMLQAIPAAIVRTTQERASGQPRPPGASLTDRGVAGEAGLHS
jgi:hypothetical protein